MKTVERQAAVLKALGRVEGYSAAIGLLKSTLETAPLWGPAAGLIRQCDEAIRMIDAIAARFERSLVVTVIGPSGSGKSTLVNALSGGGELSPTGHQRPTTGKLIVFGSGGEDAAELARELGKDAVDIRPAASGNFPAGLCLIDTPDTDSMELRRHLPALERAIAHSDVLLCVFDAENPKRRDHADFLAPVVKRFDGDSLVAVLNKCDRLEENELKTVILSDFRDYLQSAWGGAVDHALCLSARRHLREPRWDPETSPRHAFDQFDDLRRLVLGASMRGTFVIDRRAENARQLHTFVAEEVAREFAADRQALETARQTLAAIEMEAVAAAAAAMREGATALFSTMGTTVIHKLSQRWVGPVGWMLALWARIMNFGSGIASFFRLGRPFVQLRDALPTRRPRKDKKDAASEQLDAAQRSYRLELMKRWPEVSETLIRGRFDPSVRSVEAATGSADGVAEHLYALWNDCVEREIERICGRLGGLWLQVLWNAPAVSILAYVGWVTLKTFFSAQYLGGDYFLHAFWVIAIVLLLSFFALQIVIRLTAGSERILSRAFDRLRRELLKPGRFKDNPVCAQLDRLLRLAEAARG